MINIEWVSESVRMAEDIVKKLEVGLARSNQCACSSDNLDVKCDKLMKAIDLVEDDFEHFHRHWRKVEPVVLVDNVLGDIDDVVASKIA
ncbi:hypothetical protein LINPERPRIM_LOCUS2132 [Linum perenne]